MAGKPATLVPPLVTQLRPSGAIDILMGTRGHAGKSDTKKLSLAFDIDAQVMRPVLRVDVC